MKTQNGINAELTALLAEREKLISDLLKYIDNNDPNSTKTSFEEFYTRISEYWKEENAIKIKFITAYNDFLENIDSKYSDNYYVKSYKEELLKYIDEGNNWRIDSIKKLNFLFDLFEIIDKSENNPNDKSL